MYYTQKKTPRFICRKSSFYLSENFLHSFGSSDFLFVWVCFDQRRFFVFINNHKCRCLDKEFKSRFWYQFLLGHLPKYYFVFYLLFFTLGKSGSSFRNNNYKWLWYNVYICKKNIYSNREGGYHKYRECSCKYKLPKFGQGKNEISPKSSILHTIHPPPPNQYWKCII